MQKPRTCLYLQLLLVAGFVVGSITNAFAQTTIVNSLQNAGRLADWTHTGVPGGIPYRTDICASFSPGVNASTINNAISTCSTNGGVVYLNAGTYSDTSLGGKISLNVNNVTLRGAGANQTILTVSSNAGNGFITLNGDYVKPLGPISITGGATLNSTSFTVSSTSGLYVGEIIEISVLDNQSLIPINASWSNPGGRSLRQEDVITGINGSTVTVRNPLYYNYQGGSSPQIEGYVDYAIKLSGIEDLKIDLQGNGELRSTARGATVAGSKAWTLPTVVMAVMTPAVTCLKSRRELSILKYVTATFMTAESIRITPGSPSRVTINMAASAT